MFVKLKKVTKRFYDKSIFRDLDLLISGDRKVGVIGDNGTGKTTLLKLISGIDIPNAGNIEYSPADMKFAYIMSDHDLISSYDYPYEFLLPEDLSQLYEKIFVDGSTDPEVYEEFEKLNGYGVLNDLEKELKKFGVRMEDLTKTFDHLSGGERLKMQFAKFAPTHYDGILFDEPTATLDKEGKAFLYEFLETWHSMCIIASHDRKLLNSFAKQILLVEHGDIKSYTGNYDDYLRLSIDEKNRIEDENKILTRRVMDLSNESENIFDEVNTKEHVLRDNDKLSFHYKVARKNSKGLRKVEVLNKKVLRLKEDIVDVPEEKPEIQKLELWFVPPKSKELITAKDLTLKIDDRILIENADFTIKSKDRILIEGRNGIGKSTLLKAIYHGTHIDKGEIFKAKDLKIGYFEQTLSQAALLITAEDFILGGREWVNADNKINILADYFELPKTLLYKTVKDLSEGERAKLKFIKIFSFNPNFLILDEPTNFLDLRILQKLQMILSETRLPLMVVAHDDDFKQSLGANQVWTIEDKKLIIKTNKTKSS